MADTIKTVDFVLDREKLDEQIPKLLWLARPDWPAEEEVTYEKLSGGVANAMFCCYQKSKPDDKVVVRCYMSFGEGFPERDDREILNLKKVSPSGFGPRLLLIFKNGLCYEYIKGKPLNVNSVRSDEMLPLVTKTLASLHAIPVLEGDVREVVFEEWIKTSIDGFPPELRNEERVKKILEMIPDREFLQKEVNYMKEVISKVDSPTVYCHNDPKAENFLWNKDTGVLTMIDFEFSGYGSQASDVAGVFIAYNDIVNPSRDTYPDKEHQIKWIKMYLEHWFQKTGRQEKVTENDIEKLYINTNKYAQFQRLLIGVGCLFMITMNMHDCFDFCVYLLEDYFQYKDDIEALHEATLRQEKLQETNSSRK